MSPRRPSRPLPASGAFTLVELLVAMSVLVIIVVLVAQLVNSASQLTGTNTRHLDADGQARLVFERMTLDFGKMVRRADADCIFAKLPLQPGGDGRDDAMFFYSEVPAYYDGDTTDPTKLSAKSSVALVGYRINKAYQLERLGKLLTWDGVPTTGSAPGGVIFLTSPLGGQNPEPASTLAGNWPDTIGKVGDSPPFSNTSDDADYNVLAEQVFRLEICYCLRPVAHKDPNSATGGYANISRYSNIPVAAPEDVTTHKLDASVPPTVSDDISQKYQVGSRWYNASDSRGYICTNNTRGAAVWKVLGMQDVAGVVVALAVLDNTSTRVLPTVDVKLNSKQTQPSRVPNLKGLNTAFADLDAQAVQNSTDNTVPNLSATPPRLMAEAWTNELNQANFAQTAGVPRPAAAQVRIYQRYIPLNSIQ